MRFLFHILSQQPQSPLLLTGGTRRQLTPAQQTHILSDIQQHQHRFAAQPQNQLFNPPNKLFGQKNGNVVIEPSLQLPADNLQLPQQQSNQFFTTQSQPSHVNRFRQPANGPRSNELHVQHHTQTNFVPNFVSPLVAFPQQPLFERNPTVFQRSVTNQQSDTHHSFKPSQPFPAVVASPSSSSLSSSSAEQPQSIKTLQSQIYQSQQFAQSPTQFGQNQIIAPQTPTQSLSPPLHQFPHFQQLPQTQQGPNFVGPSPTQLNSQFFPDIRPDDQRYKELLEKQKIIQKHEQFVQRQQQKHQQKVRQLHEEFVQKQRRIKEQSIVNSKPRLPITANHFSQQPRSRIVSPYETPVFERAVKNYQQEHPTAPTTAPPLSTDAASNSIVRIKSSRSNLKGDISEDELEKLLTNHREKIFTHLKQDSDKLSKRGKVKPTKALGRDDLLNQLKLALADQPADLGDKNYTTMDLVLPDGQKVQVIRTTDPNLVQGATPLSDDGSILSQISSQQLIGQPSQQNAVFEQQPLLQQVADSGILPPGSNFEVIKQSADGILQSVNALPEKKKVTFVYLEEQDDGSYKVQGVKANGEKEAKTKGAEVESIINRIKNGEIQLPPPATHPAQNTATSASQRTTTRVTPSSPAPSTIFSSPSSTFESSSPTTRFVPNATPSTPAIRFISTASPYSTLATLASERLTASPSTYFASTTPRSIPTRSAHLTRGISTNYPSLSTTYSDTVSQPASSASTLSQVQTSPTASPVETTTAQSELSNILKNNGLHAMAKYLKQSGLDAILNETGPYTVFAPSDKAFKSLLVQLGGPDRAEEKFKTNPRLLSGVSSNHGGDDTFIYRIKSFSFCISILLAFAASRYSRSLWNRFAARRNDGRIAGRHTIACQSIQYARHRMERRQGLCGRAKFQLATMITFSILFVFTFHRLQRSTVPWYCQTKRIFSFHKELLIRWIESCSRCRLAMCCKHCNRIVNGDSPISCAHFSRLVCLSCYRTKVRWPATTLHTHCHYNFCCFCFCE